MDDITTEIKRDTDPNYWLVIVNGRSFSGFPSKDDALRFLRAVERDTAGFLRMFERVFGRDTSKLH